MNSNFAELRENRSFILMLIFFIAISYGFYLLADQETVVLLGKEDSFFEWITALSFLTASMLLLNNYRKTRNIWILLLGLLLFFGAGEEISWGQRLAGFETPEALNQVNVQREFNIHNLELFNRKQLNGSNSSGIHRLLEMDLLFKLFCIAFGVVLPLLHRYHAWSRQLIDRVSLPVPPLVVGLFFLMNWVCLKLVTHTPPTDETLTFAWRYFMAGPEIAESIASIVMLMICLNFHRNPKFAGSNRKVAVELP